MKVNKLLGWWRTGRCWTEPAAEAVEVGAAARAVLDWGQ
jgi:hypothetical protein